MIGRWLACAGLVCAASIAACSLGAFDGYSGGAPEGVDGGDAGSLPDVSGVDAGGVDGNGVDGGPKRFCDTFPRPTRACLDFDDGNVPLGFQSKAIEATVTVDGQGKDATKGLTVDVPADVSSDAAACLHISLSGARSKLEIEADVRASKAGTQNYDIVNLFTGDDRELGVSVTGTGLLIEEERAVDGGIESNTPTTGILENTWQRLRFVATIDGETAHTELFVDGASVGTHDALASNAGGATSFQIGDCQLVGAKSWTVHYDNVVIIESQ